MILRTYFTKLITTATPTVKSKRTNLLPVRTSQRNLHIFLLFFDFLFLLFAGLEYGFVNKFQITYVIWYLRLRVLAQAAAVCDQDFIVLGSTVEQVYWKLVGVGLGRGRLLGRQEVIFVGLILRWFLLMFRCLMRCAFGVLGSRWWIPGYTHGQFLCKGINFIINNNLILINQHLFYLLLSHKLTRMPGTGNKILPPCFPSIYFAKSFIQTVKTSIANKIVMQAYPQITNIKLIQPISTQSPTYNNSANPYKYFIKVKKMQESTDHQNSNPHALANRSGLIFTLPQPVIYHKNNPYNIASQRTIKQHHALEQETPRAKHIVRKKQKKSKQKVRSTLEIQKYAQDKEKQQKSVLQQTLYRKFVEKTKMYPAFDNKNLSDREKDKDSTHSSNVKLRQLNLVVLSKRQEIKRAKKMKGQKSEKQKDKQRTTDRTMPVLENMSPLPHFARSRSSFYKSQNGQYNTLAFLSKTIFSQIATHFTTRIPKQRAIQPFELGISKAKIVDKNSSRSFKTKRRSQQHTDLEQIGLIRFNQGLLHTNVQKKWKNYRQTSNRKRTQLRGWQQQLPQYNITQEP